MSIDDLKEKLRVEEGNFLTTKMLLQKGISNYYISKLVENRVLERKERGKYLVSLVKKDTEKVNKNNEKNLKDIKIKQFKNKVRYYNFEKAYDYLIEFYDLQTTDHSYEYIYVSLLLLKQILKGKKDFSILNDFDKDICEANLSYLSSFKISVIEGNYEQALTDLYNIKKDGHSLDVDVLFNLVKNVMKINNIPVKYENIGDFNEVDYYYKKFKDELKNGNLENAKLSLDYCIKLDFIGKISYKKELLILLKGLIDLQENKIDFNEDKGIIYEGSHEKILISAILNRDFKVAFSKIGACTYQTTNTSYLLMKDILYKMHNFKKKSQKPEIEVEKEKKEDNSLSMIYSYVISGEYEKAKEKISNSKKESRLEKLCSILFEELNIVKNKYKYYERVTLDSDDFYGRVFESIRLCDLYQARELLKEVIPLATYKKELQIYATLIDEILYQNKNMKKKQDSNSKLIPFFNNGMYLSLEDVTNVKTILEERIEIVGENKRDYHLLNIIDVILVSSEIPLAKDDFSSIPNEKTKPLDKLNEYLDNGEYILAKELIDKTPDWKVFASDYSIFDIKMIKYLLKTLEKNLYQYISSNKNINEELKEPPSIYSLVKHRKYKEALQFYLEHEDLLYETEEKDLIKNLVILYYFQLDEGIKLYEEYLKAKEEGNRDLERIALLNYKEYLKINNVDDNYVPVLKK